MKLPRRILLFLAAAVLLAAVVYAFIPRPLAVDAAEVTRGSMTVSVNEDGVTRIRERYVVSAPLPGRLLRITLDPGDRVAARETLLAAIQPLDPALLDERARAEAAARVSGGQAAVSRAQAALRAAVAELEFAQGEVERLRDAARAGGAGRQELEAAELRARTREQDRDAAAYALEIARFELDQARAAFLRSRPDADDPADDATRFEIHAPVTGVVLRVFQQSAAVVAAGTPLVEIGDPSDLEVVIDVLSTDAVRVTPGDRVVLERWGGPGELLGVVRTVEPAAFTKTSALGVEEQRVNIIADLHGPAGALARLGDNYRVDARIVVWQRADALQVPAAALIRGRDSTWSVFTIEGGRAALRPVEIGQRNDAAAEVLGGLQPGARVIVHPSDRVAPGVRVAPRP